MKWQVIEMCDVCGCARCAFALEADGTVHRLCNDSDLQEMVERYLETALWSSSEYDDNGSDLGSLDESYSTDDVSNGLFTESVADCAWFLDSHADWLDDVDPGTAGHNFWLSRNGHGAGFFDSGAEHADELQKACRPYGSVDLYVVDDGRIYS